MALVYDAKKSAWANHAPIAPAAPSAAAPTKAEFDALVAKFNALLVAFRAAGRIHG